MNPRTKKALHWIGIVLGALLLLVVLFLIEEHIRGRVELNRYVAKMHARGEKLSIAEIRPLPALPDQNGAGLFMAGGFGTGKVVNENLPFAMRYVAPGKAIAMIHRPAWATKGRGHPSLGTNGINAMWHTNTSTTMPEGHAPMLVTAEDLAADVHFFSNSFVQAHAALEFSVFDFGLNYDDGFNIRLPHLAKMKSTANWLRAASLSALYETNNTASLNELLALASLSRVSTNEPLLISQLVRCAIFQIAAGATWEALQADGWTDAQLAQLQSAFSAFDGMRPMERALEMERAMGLWEVDRAARDPTAFFKGWGGLDIDIDLVPTKLPTDYDEMLEPIESLFHNLKPIFLRCVYIPIWGFAWRDFDKLNLLRTWQRGIDAARWQTVNRAWVRNPIKIPEEAEPDPFNNWSPGGYEGDSRSLYDRVRFLLSSLMIGSTERSVRRALIAEATKELAITSLALQRFRFANGRWPESLEQLVPKFLVLVPIDPFDGKPIRYEQTNDDAFILYSVGPNGRDDHGDASPDSKGTTPNLTNGRDIVWPRAASPKEVEKVIQSEAARSRNSTAL